MKGYKVKKDFTRDYTTEIFRLYAAAGEPTYEREKKRIYEAQLIERAHIDPALAVSQARAETEKRTPYLLDILAAEKTIGILERGEKGYIVDAIKAVYFVAPLSPLRRGDISNRVRRFALTFPTDERTVYRWLQEARLLCAAFRGLRIGGPEKQLIEIYRPFISCCQ